MQAQTSRNKVPALRCESGLPDWSSNANGDSEKHLGPVLSLPFQKTVLSNWQGFKMKWPKTWKTYLNGKKREICAIAFVFLTLKGKEMRWKQFESTCIISCNGMLNLVDKSIVYKIWSYTYWNWKWLWSLRANEINLWNGCGGFSVNF